MDKYLEIKDKFWEALDGAIREKEHEIAALPLVFGDTTYTKKQAELDELNRVVDALCCNY